MYLVVILLKNVHFYFVFNKSIENYLQAGYSLKITGIFFTDFLRNHSFRSPISTLLLEGTKRSRTEMSFSVHSWLCAL